MFLLCSVSGLLTCFVYCWVNFDIQLKVGNETGVCVFLFVAAIFDFYDSERLEIERFLH